MMTVSRFCGRIRRSPSFCAGAVMLIVLVLAMSAGPALIPYDPYAIELSTALEPPSLFHWLGTDDLVLWAFPFYVLVISIIGSLGPGLANMYLAFTLVVWISFARIVRGEVLVVKRAEYVMAARVLGYGNARIILRHVLPNTITPAIVFAMSDVVLTILAVTSLSFLGLGIQPPSAEWGLMIAEGRNFIFDAWWIATAPGLAIIYVGIAFMLLGDGLDDLLRP